MVIMSGIDRAPTEAERREMTVVGEKSLMDMFRGELAKKEQEFVKQHLPFDGQCAKADYEDKILNLQRESERIYGFVREQDLEKAKIDLDRYGDMDRFEIVVDDEETELVNVNGLRSTAEYCSSVTIRNAFFSIVSILILLIALIFCARFLFSELLPFALALNSSLLLSPLDLKGVSCGGTSPIFRINSYLIVTYPPFSSHQTSPHKPQ